MAVNLDSEIVATTFNPYTRMCSYTIERDGKRWTVDVPLAELDKHGALPGSLNKRRAFLATALQNKMNGPPDAT